MASHFPPFEKIESPHPLFFIGRDKHGHWIVRDDKFTCGGMFVDRAQALRFAFGENGDRLPSVVSVPDGIELAPAEASHTPRGTA